jgi:hypothetical protein
LEKFAVGRRAVRLPGDQPWVSIHGVNHAALRPGNAAASRGLIIRSWQSTLGGKPSALPHLSTIGTEIAKGSLTTALELSVPPHVTELRSGDFVEADLELVMFPAKAADYWGPDGRFRDALTRDADTWRLVHAEAAQNVVAVENVTGVVEERTPLRVRVDAGGRARLTVRGGRGFVPVTFTGIGSSREFGFNFDGAPLNQGVHGRDYWQADYEEATRSYALTFNVPLDEQAHTMELVATPVAVKRAGAADKAREPVLTP